MVLSTIARSIETDAASSKTAAASAATTKPKVSSPPASRIGHGWDEVVARVNAEYGF